jgi:peptidyl-tRNA hydrolase, PTH1 family
VNLRRAGAAELSDTWLVVGLGNPGPSYAGTRHNIGYVVVDALAERMGGRLRRHKSQHADVLEGRLELGGPRLVLGRGRTYMNESGGPVKSLMTFYRVRNDHLVVVHDELDLPFGGLRVKLGGGDNGHNGLRSVRAAIGTGDYNRVRVGIGRPMDRVSTSDYVLGQFSPSERSGVSLLAARSADAVASLLSSGLEATQQSFNNAKT